MHLYKYSCAAHGAPDRKWVDKIKTPEIFRRIQGHYRPTTLLPDRALLFFQVPQDIIFTAAIGEGVIPEDAAEGIDDFNLVA